MSDLAIDVRGLSKRFGATSVEVYQKCLRHGLKNAAPRDREKYFLLTARTLEGFGDAVPVPITAAPRG